MVCFIGAIFSPYNCADVIDDALEQRLNDATEKAVKRRDPGIQQLVRKYNTLVTQMEDLIIRKKAPCHARAPLHIDLDGLFRLDVDDHIWQDVGLGYDFSQSDIPPAWLADDNVRMGIRAMLDVDRCDEEDKRLGVEEDAMRDWFREEWSVLQKAQEDSTSEFFGFHCQYALF
jgi:hypothetical protein